MNGNPFLRRSLAVGLAVVALIWFGGRMMPIADAQSAGDVPTFEVDAAWPKPLPNNWAVGPVSGIATDARDHIWIFTVARPSSRRVAHVVLLLGSSVREL